MRLGVEASRGEAGTSGIADRPGASEVRDLLGEIRYRDDSPFQPHLGLLLWSLRILAPRSFVQIGVGDLLPYFAACQAMGQLGIAGRCTGIAPPGTAIGADVLRHEQSFHAGLSQLVPADPVAAASAREPGSVDFLLLSPELRDIEALLQAWRPTLSPRAVVIIHGTGPDLLGEATATALATRHPAIFRPEGLGLALVLVGDQPDPNLLALASLQEGVGSSADFLADLAALSERAWTGSRDEASLYPELAEMVARLEAREAEIQRLQASLDQRFRELVILEKAKPRGLSRRWSSAHHASPLPRRWLLAARGRAGNAARKLLDRSPPALAAPARKAAQRARRLLRL